MESTGKTKQRSGGRSKVSKYIRVAILVIYILSALITAVYAVFSLASGDPDRRLINGEAVNLKKGWTMDGHGEIVRLPFHLSDSEEYPVTIRCALPSEGRDDWILMIKSNHQTIDVKIDGKDLNALHSYDPAGSTSHFGGYIPYHWEEVSPGAGWQGKEISITYTSNAEAFRSTLGTVLIGDRLSVLYLMVMREIFFILTVFTLITIGILLSVLNLILHRNGQSRTGFTNVAALMIFLGLMFFCRLECVQLLIPNMVMTENLGILCFLMTPIPLIITIDQISESRYSNIAILLAGADVLGLLFIIPAFLVRGGQTLLHFLPLGVLLYYLPLFFILYVAVRSALTDAEFLREIRWFLILSLVLYLCIIIDTVLITSDSNIIHISHGLFTASGTLIMAIGMMSWAASRYRDILDRMNAVEAEAKARFEFYSGISHKVRTPINGILGMNEMILRESEDPRITGYAKDIKKSGSELMDIVEEMLRFSGVNSEHNEETGDTGPDDQSDRSELIGRFTAPKASVLVVDDTDVNRRLAEHLLKRTKIRVSSVSSGKECLEKVKTDLFDVILMDHLMPEMDGIETLHALKSMGIENLSHSAVVIALTANAIEGTREYYLQQGFDDYLSKPVDGHTLEDMLLKYIPDIYIIPDDESGRKEEEGRETARDNGEDMDRYGNIIRSLSGIIDTDTGLRYCMNDPEFYIRTLERFADADKQDLLTEEYDKRDNDNYRIHVHALKSSARLLGAQPLSDQAAAIEDAMSKGDNDFVTANHPLLMNEYTRVRLSVENAFRENPPEEDGELVPIDTDEIRHLLEEIRDGLDEFDMDAADSAARKLSSAGIQEEYGEDVRKLVSLVADVDLDNALNLVNGLLERM